MLMMLVLLERRLSTVASVRVVRDEGEEGGRKASDISREIKAQGWSELNPKLHQNTELSSNRTVN